MLISPEPFASGVGEGAALQDLERCVQDVSADDGACCPLVQASTRPAVCYNCAPCTAQHCVALHAQQSEEILLSCKQVLKLRACRGAAPGSLQLAAAAPEVCMRLTPLQAKRVCATRLALSLQQGLVQQRCSGREDPGCRMSSTACSEAELRHGLLTMDRARSLVLLDAADPAVSKPLIASC